LTSSNLGQNYYYVDIQIDISKNGLYEFESQSSIDMCAYFYENSFNSTNKDFNLLIFDNNSGGNNQFDFQISLQSTNNYILVVTTYYSYVTGSFSIYVTGPTTVSFN